MAEQFQCRFCQKSYKEVLGFLDHFETHMNKKDVTQQEQQNSNHFEDNEKHNQKIQTQMKARQEKEVLRMHPPKIEIYKTLIH